MSTLASEDNTFGEFSQNDEPVPTPVFFRNPALIDVIDGSRSVLTFRYWFCNRRRGSPSSFKPPTGKPNVSLVKPKNGFDSLTERLSSFLFHKRGITPRPCLRDVATGNITALLEAHAAGDPNALDDLFPLVYEELHQIAHRRMQGERSDHTLRTTALVHEAYMELVDLDRVDWQDRQHFFALAARVMRNVLVDYAVRRNAQKRGGGRDRVPLKEWDGATEVVLEDVIAVHQALKQLETVDKRQVRVVECRFFGGLTIDETSNALGISTATVGRDWRMARAWLNRELTNGGGTCNE